MKGDAQRPAPLALLPASWLVPDLRPDVGVLLAFVLRGPSLVLGFLGARAVLRENRRRARAPRPREPWASAERAPIRPSSTAPGSSAPTRPESAPPGHCPPNRAQAISCHSRRRRRRARTRGARAHRGDARRRPRH